MKRFFKHWNFMEILILIMGISLISIAFAFGAEKNYFALATSLLGVIASMLIAKGFVFAPIIDVIQTIMYSFLCISQKFYGEVIICLGFLVPMGMFSIRQWFKNRDETYNEFVVVNKLKNKEYGYIALIAPIAMFVFYVILRLIATEQAFMNTLTLSALAIGCYLAFRRSPYFSVAYICYDILCMVLWILTIENSGTEFLPTILSCFVYLVNDTYCLYFWKLSEKKQRNRRKKKHQSKLQMSTV